MPTARGRGDLPWGALGRACCMAFALMGTVSVARAQADTPETEESVEDRARAHYARGRALVESEEFGPARAEFEAGYALSRRPLFLFNMGESALHMQDPAGAREAFRRYLSEDPQGTMAQTARLRLTELGAPVETPTIPAPREAAASADDTDPITEGTTVDLTLGALEPAELGLDWYEDWPFWTITGAVLAAVATAITVGVVLSVGQSATCDAGCRRIEWGTP